MYGSVYSLTLGTDYARDNCFGGRISCSTSSTILSDESTTTAFGRLLYFCAHSCFITSDLRRNTCFPCSSASRACIFAPLVELASTTTVPIDIPLITTFRSGKFIARGGESGQNCDTRAPCSRIPSASGAFSGG